MASLELRPISARMPSAWVFNSGETRARIIPVLAALDRRGALVRTGVFLAASFLGIVRAPDGRSKLYPVHATVTRPGCLSAMRCRTLGRRPGGPLPTLPTV